MSGAVRGPDCGLRDRRTRAGPLPGPDWLRPVQPRPNGAVRQASGVELELAVGSYNYESIRNYSANSVHARLGRLVGRLDILTDPGSFPVPPSSSVKSTC